jgi:hypothetical protein
MPNTPNPAASVDTKTWNAMINAWVLDIIDFEKHQLPMPDTIDDIDNNDNDIVNDDQANYYYQHAAQAAALEQQRQQQEAIAALARQQQQAAAAVAANQQRNIAIIPGPVLQEDPKRPGYIDPKELARFATIFYPRDK